MRSRRFIFVPVVLCLAAPLAHAQSAVPDAVLVAEAAEQWEEAARLFRVALDGDPRRADLWSRLADVEARRGNTAAVIDALQHATEVAPATASLHAGLSQAYAIAEQPAAALEAIEAAVALEPSSPAHLQARATLATWAADYKRAQDSYRRLAKLRPTDLDLVLAHARVSAWAGDTDEAVNSYQRYLRARPALRDVWLELAKAESWRGNYASALRALEAYRSRFGETAAYARELAAVMAYGDRPNKAEDTLRPLLSRAPDSFDLQLTRTITLAMQRRSREAFASLDTIRQLSPESRETRNAQRVLRTLLASTAEPRLSFYTDSDRLEILRFAPRATISLATGTQISAGFERTELGARQGSGLEQLDGSLSADYEHAWVAGAQKLRRVTLNGTVGYATTNGRDMTTYIVGAETRAADSLRFAVERSSGFFIVSPRTIGLGLTQIGHRTQIDWSPTLRDRIAFEASYQELSDGNRRRELTFSPRRSVARTATFNVDLGFSAYRLETDDDLDSGYYDPRRYEQYAAVFYPYLKIRENIGLALTAAAGAQRDAMSPSFQFGGSASGEATFGIYEPWMFKVSASATMNRRLESGAFRGLSGHVALIRRF